MRWEYQVLGIVKDNDSANLRRFGAVGAEGWELVSVDNGIAYFKRPIKEITVSNVYVDGVPVKQADDD